MSQIDPAMQPWFILGGLSIPHQVATLDPLANWNILNLGKVEMGWVADWTWFDPKLLQI